MVHSSFCCCELPESHLRSPPPSSQGPAGRSLVSSGRGKGMRGADATAFRVDSNPPTFSQRRAAAPLPPPRRSYAGLSGAIPSGLSGGGALALPASGQTQVVMATRFEVAEMPLGRPTSHRRSLWSTRRRMLAGPGG